MGRPLPKASPDVDTTIKWYWDDFILGQQGIILGPRVKSSLRKKIRDFKIIIFCGPPYPIILALFFCLLFFDECRAPHATDLFQLNHEGQIEKEEFIREANHLGVRSQKSHPMD